MRFRRVYGYIGEISRLQERAEIPIAVRTPARIQAVVKLWWRYVPIREEAYDSCLCVLVIAFASTAAYDVESKLLTVGDPIAGLIEASSSDHAAAQLLERTPISAAEWKLSPPRTVIGHGFELNGDAIGTPPDLAKGDFGHFHLPNAPSARLYGFWDPKYLDPYVKEPAAAAASRARSERPRDRPSSPKNSPERRMRERYYARVAAKKDAAL